MQVAVLELERQFARCSGDLDLIVKKLDEDFEGNKAFARNPLRILQRVKALQDDLPKVQEDWQRVMVAKQTIIDVARSQQLTNHRLLKQLHSAAGVEVGEADTEEPFERFKGIHEQWEKENASRVSSMRQDLYGHMLLAPEELNMEVLRTAHPVQGQGEGDDSESEKGGDEDAETAGAAGQNQPENKQKAEAQIHISEAEFMSVSNIVRGRCKREECNELLDLIISNTKKGKGGVIQPLTTAELVRIGARVTGQTGGSRLATLRCLKRITISKEGVMVNKNMLC